MNEEHTEEHTAAGEAPAASGSCAAGCSIALAGLVAGFVAEETAIGLMRDAWTTCYNLIWPFAYDLQDSPRLYIFQEFGWLLVYSFCLPVGFWAARRLLRRRGRLLRLGAGLLAPAVLLTGALGTDLMLNISAVDGLYLKARCPQGLPPWWPSLLPTRRTPFLCGGSPCRDLPR